MSIALVIRLRLPQAAPECQRKSERQRRKHERRRLCLGETHRGRLLTFVVIERKGKVRFVTAYPMHGVAAQCLSRRG